MTDFDCTRFARWLDDGGADRAEAAAHAEAEVEAHAALCGGCGERLVAARAVAAVLGGGGVVDDEGVQNVQLGPVVQTVRTLNAAPSPPAGFADRVMAEVALTRQGAPTLATVTLPGDMIPWWIRAAAQPASVLAFTLAGLATAFAPQLLGLSRNAPQWSADALVALSGALAPWLGRASALAGSDPLAGTGVALGVLPLVALASIGFYRFGASLATVRFASPLARSVRAPRA